MRRITILVASLILLALTSCSDSDPESANDGAQVSEDNSEAADDARATVDTYIEAVRTADGEAGCAALSSDAQKQLALYNHSEEAAGDCTAAFSEFSGVVTSEREEELEKVKAGEAEISEDGETATVSLTYPESSDADEDRYVSLKQEDDRWLLENIYEP